MYRTHVIAAIVAALLAAVVFAALASGAAGFPRIHTPRGHAGEFAYVDVYIGNSDRHTRVEICVSHRCGRAQRIARHTWTKSPGGSEQALRGPVRVTAANPSHGRKWGVAAVTFG